MNISQYEFNFQSCSCRREIYLMPFAAFPLTRTNVEIIYKSANIKLQTGALIGNCVNFRRAKRGPTTEGWWICHKERKSVTAQAASSDERRGGSLAAVFQHGVLRLGSPGSLFDKYARILRPCPSASDGGRCRPKSQRAARDYKRESNTAAAVAVHNCSCA